MHMCYNITLHKTRNYDPITLTTHMDIMFTLSKGCIKQIPGNGLKELILANHVGSME